MDRQKFSAFPGGHLGGEWLGRVITLFNSRGAARSWLLHFTCPSPRAVNKCGSRDSKFSPTLSTVLSSFHYHCLTGHTSWRKELCQLMISEVSARVSWIHCFWPRWGGRHCLGCVCQRLLSSLWLESRHKRRAGDCEIKKETSLGGVMV